VLAVPLGERSRIAPRLRVRLRRADRRQRRHRGEQGDGAFPEEVTNSRSAAVTHHTKERKGRLPMSRSLRFALLALAICTLSSSAFAFGCMDCDANGCFFSPDSGL